MNDRKVAEDNGKETWYPIKDAKFEKMAKFIKEHINHTSVSVSHTTMKSKLVTTAVIFIGLILSDEDFLEDFHSEVPSEAAERDVSKIRNDYLTTNEIDNKVIDQRNVIQRKDSEIFFLRQKLAQAIVRKRELKEELKEFAKEDNMKAICKRLTKAYDEKKLENKHVLLGLLQSVAKNFHIKGNTGKRYPAPLRKFYESLLIMGGPKIAMFVALNLEGPMMSSVYTWRNNEKVSWSREDLKVNIKIAREIISKAIEHLGLKGPLVAETSEDETAIIGKITYSQRNDELLGICGPKGDNHQCSHDVRVVLGEGDEAYQRIVDTFENMVIGKHARVIILNVLHPKMPKLVLLLMPTCNRFTHQLVRTQWEEIKHLCRTHLSDLITLIGHATDGDGRRWKLHLELLETDGFD